MTTRRASTAWWILLLVAVLSVFPVATAVISQADAVDDPLGTCWAADLPAGVVPHDNTLRSVEVTTFPVGAHCDWEAGDVQTGWPLTIAALVGSAACLVATAFALRVGPAARRVVSALPLVAVVVIWIVLSQNTLFVIID
ncbi:MAG: hypothetical protein J7484_01465 [Microbacterium sp.]|nr:hypothetical protein [Microbacterium sp.]